MSGTKIILTIINLKKTQYKLTNIFDVVKVMEAQEEETDGGWRWSPEWGEGGGRGDSPSTVVSARDVHALGKAVGAVGGAGRPRIGGRSSAQPTSMSKAALKQPRRSRSSRS